MSVSLAVAAKHGYVASLGASNGALSPTPWGAPTAPEDDDGFGLSGIVMHFAPDREIYAEGDEARCFYKVVSGVVRTCRFLSDGRRQIDSFHVTGDVFGFEAGADHRLAAEAVSHCTVIAYRRRGLETTITQDDRLGRWFFSHAMTSTGTGAGTRAAAGAQQRGAKDLGIPAGDREAGRQQQPRRSGDEPAGYRRLPRPDDRDRVAHPVATGARRHHRSAVRSADRAEGPAGAAGAEFLRATLNSSCRYVACDHGRASDERARGLARHSRLVSCQSDQSPMGAPERHLAGHAVTDRHDGPCRPPQSPLKSGFRFSRNAFTASR